MKNDKSLSPKQLRNYHNELWHTPQGKAIREIVFGMNDGLISMIGFIAGLIGAVEASKEIFTIRIGGIAELIAGSISMALGAYLSTKSQIEFFSEEIEREKHEIKYDPQREKQELVDIYKGYGFLDEEVEMIVNRITSSEKMWLNFMIKEELGLIEERFDNPVNNALIMGISFVIGSLPPLIPYLLPIESRSAFISSILLSIISLFLIGAGKTKVTNKSIFKSGLEVLMLGIIASTIGFTIGHLFSYLL
ncbi:MAG: VIT1/CCC1 transporter family protein [Spirochaetota bacterium]|nr:VIT1/CCC1 transporter family protein [Spirochaetota bacterium]